MKTERVGEQSRGRESFVLGTLLCAYAAWAMSPLMARTVSSQFVLALVVGCLTVGAVLVIGPKVNTTGAWPAHLVFRVVLVFLMLTFAYLRVSDTVAFGNFVATCLFFLPLIFAVVLSRLGAVRTTWFVLVAAVGVSAVVAIYSIMILRADPYASKYLTGSITTAVERYANTNLATVPWVMGAVLLLPLILGMVALADRTVLKVFLGGAFVANFGLILLASSSTSTFIAIAFLAVTALRTLVKRPVRAIVQLALIALVTTLYFPQLGGSLSDDSAGLYEDRFSEAGAILVDGQSSDSDGSFAVRIFETKRSVNSFFDSPLLGVGMVHGDPGKDPTLEVGMHSQIIDDFGRYGILGALLIFGIYFHVFTGVRARTRGISRYYAMSALALAALLAILNPVMFPVVGFVTLGMIPLFASLAVERRSE